MKQEHGGVIEALELYWMFEDEDGNCDVTEDNGLIPYSLNLQKGGEEATATVYGLDIAGAPVDEIERALYNYFACCAQRVNLRRIAEGRDPLDIEADTHFHTLYVVDEDGEEIKG